jgi:arylsulfatase A-like enzyme/Flp pilus assembly protein TadD
MRFFRLSIGIVLFAVSAGSAYPQASKPHSTTKISTKPRPTTPSRPNILLITLDTTRADRLGFLGSKLGLTPNLDELAKQGVAFSRAFAHVPLTTASHATILTGTYPQFNHVNDFGVPLGVRLPYLPDLLHQNGYRTAAFVGSLVLDPLDGTAPGFDRGFDVYDAGFRMRPRGGDRYKTVERRAEDVVNRSLAWLGRPGNGPFFVWVHLYDAHDPYDPPAPYKQKFATEPYDGEIAYADAQLGRLFAALRSHAMFDNTLIAVMADHGEALGQHGEQTHGVFLYDETLHVPLLIKLPKEASAGRSISTQVRLVDVMPTILESAHVAVPQEVQGESLLPLIKAAPANNQAASSERPAYAETDYPHRAFNWSSVRALRTGKYTYIQAPDPELYDQSTDPGQLHNSAPTSKAIAATLKLQLTQFRDKTTQSLKELAALTPEQEANLAALGYVGSSSTNSASDAISGIDPKTKIEVANLLHDAMLDVEDTRFSEAVPLLERVLKDEPNMPVAAMQLGIAQVGLKHYAEAIEPLQKAVQLAPDSGLGHYHLGLALFQTGNWKDAAPQFEAAVARAPKWADAHFSLAAVYARIDRVPEAMKELDITLALTPNHYRANLLRGRILSLQGDPVAALPNLLKAAEVEPGSREAHLFLADAYSQMGQPLDAARERAAAQQGQQIQQ